MPEDGVLRIAQEQGGSVPEHLQWLEGTIPQLLCIYLASNRGFNGRPNDAIVKIGRSIFYTSQSRLRLYTQACQQGRFLLALFCCGFATLPQNSTINALQSGVIVEGGAVFDGPGLPSSSVA